MRIVSYRLDGKDRVGILSHDTTKVMELHRLSPEVPHDLAACLPLGPALWETLERRLSAAPADAWVHTRHLQFLPLLPRPGKIICLGLNYADHAAEGGHARPDYPSIFLRASTSLIGHGAPLVLPKVSSALDFEAELAVIIGRQARHLTASDALDCVAGYARFNDATLRDYQKRTSQWTVGKNFDGTGAFGPWFVPASDLPPGAAGLRIESRLNGEVMQRDNTANMLFPVQETLCLLTEALTLEAGDVIAMGTPAGVGYARKPPVWMREGDRIEIEIEGIGTLANTVAGEQDRSDGRA